MTARFARRGVSLKWKVSVALALLLAVNSAYFYNGARAIGEMNGLVTSLYDKVVMSSTYAQMVKSDFLRYSQLATAAITGAGDGAGADAAVRLTEQSDAFRDDLTVVFERIMNPSEGPEIQAIQADFDALKPVVLALVNAPARDAATTLARARDWLGNARRVALLDKIVDLTDRIVADGYAYRLASVERTATIRRLTVAFSIAVLIFDVLCLGFILFTILPPLRQLTGACVDIANGHFGKRVSLRSRDEFGRLADAFNVMLEALKRSEDKVQDQLVTTNAMIDGLGQGFFFFDRTGLCQPEHSRACLDLLERAPAGRPAREVLGVPAADAADFRDWLEVVFADVGTFEDLAALGPATYPHGRGLTVALEYRAMRDQHGALRGILVVATDRTAEVRARTAADHEQEFSAMIGALFRNRADFTRFGVESARMIEDLERADLPTALRQLHTLKGGAATFAMRGLRDEAHAGESLLATIDPRDPIRLGRELLVVRDRLRARHARTLAELEAHCGFGLGEGRLTRDVPVADLERFCAEMAADADVPGAWTLRFRRDFVFEPIADLLRPFADVVREVAERLGKRVRPLIVVGGDIAVSRERVQPVLSPLVHVFRNAVDHGIEDARERERGGKPAEATITVHVERSEAAGRPWLTVKVEDDGRGIDALGLRAKLRERGAVVEGESDHQILQHVFDAGVSTAAAVTDLSGRGIGLDAVRAAAVALGGTAMIDSVPGRGSAVTVRIPDPS